MNSEQELAIEEVSNDIWNDNLWFRKLSEESKKAVAQTIWLMRTDRINGKVRFAKTMVAEIDALLLNKEVANA
jgi:hypothetical protein